VFKVRAFKADFVLDNLFVEFKVEEVEETA